MKLWSDDISKVMTAKQWTTQSLCKKRIRRISKECVPEVKFLKEVEALASFIADRKFDFLKLYLLKNCVFIKQNENWKLL